MKTKQHESTVDSKISSVIHQHIEAFGRLGTEIKISPKANICKNKPGFKKEFFVETVSVTIGIGKDHTAELVMTKDAWEALNAGEAIHVTTTGEFKKMHG